MSTIKSLFFSSLLLITSVASAEVILKDLQGNKIPFSSLKGKWVFINYWASWCQPCVEEIPELNQFYNKYKNANVALFAVNYDALPSAEQEILVKDLHIKYPALQNDPGSELEFGEITGVPVTFVFNPEGKLMGRLLGGQSEQDLINVLKG